MDLLTTYAAKEELSEEDVKQIPGFSKQNIRNWLKSCQESGFTVKNLKLLLALHENDQLQITTYLHFCEDESSFVDLLVNHIASSSEENLSMTSDVLSVLIPFQNDMLATEKYCTVLHHFVKRVCVEATPLAPLVQHLAKSPYRIPFKLHEFLEYLTQETINSRTPRQTQEKFISNQKNEFATLHSDALYLFLQEVLKVLPVRSAYLMEDRNLVENAIWPFEMSLVSVLLNSSEPNARWLLEYIDRSFKSALSRQFEQKVINALLLIRQCCLEQIKPVYSSYAHWFSNLQIKARVEFEFFFAVLSRLVPHENPTYLKIHINKAPSIPANCQTVYSDYSQLARTQLIDLNETVEYLGLFGTTEYEDRQTDVRRVLSHYQETGDIAPILHKACVFRREYYRDVFLRDLLDLRDPALREVQAAFVQTLRTAGKMPALLYETWPLKPAS